MAAMGGGAATWLMASGKCWVSRQKPAHTCGWAWGRWAGCSCFVMSAGESVGDAQGDAIKGASHRGLPSCLRGGGVSPLCLVYVAPPLPAEALRRIALQSAHHGLGGRVWEWRARGQGGATSMVLCKALAWGRGGAGSRGACGVAVEEVAFGPPRSQEGRAVS